MYEEDRHRCNGAGMEMDKDMNLYEKIVNGEEKLSLVGLGYVGMPIAVAFAKKINVIGFDLNEAKINLYKKSYRMRCY